VILYASVSEASAQDLLLPDFTEANGWLTPRTARRPRVLERTQNGSLNHFGEEFVIIKLAERCSVSRIELVKASSKGLDPERCFVERLDCPHLFAKGALEQKTLCGSGGKEYFWQPVEEWTLDDPHVFSYAEKTTPHTATHIRLRMIPDGCLKRLRVYGEKI